MEAAEFPLGPEPYFRFLSLIFRKGGLVVMYVCMWRMGRDSRTAGRMNNERGGAGGGGLQVGKRA
jgi:hypothetical protein